MASLPLVPNSGNHVVTGCAGSSAPSPIRCHTVEATSGLVAEKRQKRVSGPASPNVARLDDLAVTRQGELGGGQHPAVDVTLDALRELLDGSEVGFVGGQRHAPTLTL